MRAASITMGWFNFHTACERGAMTTPYLKSVNLFLTLGLLALSSCNSGNGKEAKNATVLNLSDCDSSSSSQSAIVNGRRIREQDAEAGEAVFLISLLEKNKVEVCTASAIADNVLITAAHCIITASNKMRVGLITSVGCGSGFDMRQAALVQDVVVNPEYTVGKLSKDDVALLFLKEKLPSRFKVHKIATPSDQKGKAIEFLGYGEVGYNKGGTLTLRKTQITSQYVKVDETSGIAVIDQSHGTGICYGDSGGPGFINVNNEKKILSVNSAVTMGVSTPIKQPSCNSGARLTLIYPHLPWIKDELKKRYITLED